MKKFIILIIFIPLLFNCNLLLFKHDPKVRLSNPEDFDVSILLFLSDSRQNPNNRNENQLANPDFTFDVSDEYLEVFPYTYDIYIEDTGEYEDSGDEEYEKYFFETTFSFESNKTYTILFQNPEGFYDTGEITITED